MIRIRRGVVRTVRERRPGLLDLSVDVDGSIHPAVAYPDLCGPVRDGDRVVLNTTAVSLGLGTGGVDFVVAVEGGPDQDAETGARAMKLRYTPVQAAVVAVEETGASMPESLDGLPVVAAGLHSALPAIAVAAHAVRPGVRVAYLMTDGAALPLAFSDVVAALRKEGLLDSTVTCGQAFGGDVEAVNVYSGLLAARATGAEIVVAAMGPGNLGTGSRYGFATMEVASICNAAASLGGRPIAPLRMSFADARERHAGVSHHSLTALCDATYPRVSVPVPPLPVAEQDRCAAALARIGERHDVIEIDLGPAQEALESSPVPLRSMGRGYEEDPHYFRAAAAAGVYAATR